MINVNLLPYHLRPVKRTPLLYILGGLLLIGVILGIAFKWNANRTELNRREQTLADNKQALANLQETVQKYNSLMKEKIQFGKRLEIIDEIVRDQIIWSRQLWSLNRLAPDNIWYDRVEEKIKNVRETHITTDPETNKQEVTQVTVKKNFLIVEGYVVPSSEDGEANISPLMIASSDPKEEFARHFQIQQHSFKDTTFEDFPVKQFTIEYLIGQFEMPEEDEEGEDEGGETDGGDQE